MPGRDHPNDMEDDMNVRYPELEVQLTGENGNAMAVISAVCRALRRGGVPATEVTAFTEEAMSGDYDNVLRTCMRWVEVS